MKRKVISSVFIVFVIFMTGLIACNNGSKSEDKQSASDTVVKENPVEGRGAANAAGNTDAANVGTDTTAVGTNKNLGKDSIHNKK
jgi:hypothetical protein